VEYFEAGDMVLLGSNIPHVWLSDEIYYKGMATLKAKAIVVYFNKEIFSQAFYELKEASKLTTLFDNAVRGLRITGKTNTILANKLERLTAKKDFDIIVGLFEILSILAASTDISFINNEAYTPISRKQHSDRISDVLNYVKVNYKEDITLTGISKIASLTPQSFCRLFKKRMKKHFLEYLNEVRISNACKLLIETDLSISEVAYDCGYKTVSNFNKLFKKIVGTTPKTYKLNAGNSK
jgi:YesN/AraC family two-component response regulator